MTEGGLDWDKFDAMSRQHPRLALDLCRGVAAVLVGDFVRALQSGTAL